MAKLLLAFVFIWKLFAITKGQQVPCFFIFGDSLVDNGNNNDLITMAKANYPPYGVDFDNGFPSGRFTNGLNIADILGQILGFQSYIPPFVATRGSDITKGVNYGSGASGIRKESGKHMGDNFSFNRQLNNHRSIVSRLKFLLGSRSAAENRLNKCLYAVVTGNNDYINNYFLPQYYLTSRLYTPERYAQLLIQQFSQQLQTLYSYGARKIAVFGLGLIGCIPEELEAFGTNGSPCVDSVNAAAQLFNLRLKTLIDDLNNRLTGAKFILINSTSIGSSDPTAVGIKFVNTPCCVVSKNFAKGQCVPGQIPCSNRSEYVFFDNYHTTFIVNLGTASRAYTAMLPTDAYPYDISRLIQQ